MDMEWNDPAGIREDMKEATRGKYPFSGLYVVFPPYHADYGFFFQETLDIFGSAERPFVGHAGYHR